MKRSTFLKVGGIGGAALFASLYFGFKDKIDRSLSKMLDFDNEDGKGLPSAPDALKERKSKRYPSSILDAQGEKLFEYKRLHEEPFQHFDHIPPALVQALLTSEDKEFFTRPGVWDELMTKARRALKGRGGSTIEMQLAKIILERPTDAPVTGSQKKREIIMAQKLLDYFSQPAVRKAFSAPPMGWKGDRPKREMTAKEIMISMYINMASFNYDSIGFQAGAKTFFNKEAEEMTMEEWSVMVVMLQANTKYNPYRGKKNKEMCLHERNIVLTHLGDEVKINSAGKLGKKHDAATITAMKKSGINLERGNIGLDTGIAPHLRAGALHDELIELLKDENIAGELGLTIVTIEEDDRKNEEYKGKTDDQILAMKREKIADIIDSKLPFLGLEIETTLDAKAQKIAEATFHEEMEKMRNDANMKMKGAKGSVLITSNKEENPASIVAWVGGDNFKEDQVDWVEAKRQVGSMMKELVYAVAMEKGIISDINSTKYISLIDGQEYDLLDQDGLERNSGAKGAPSSPVRNSDRKYVGGPITWAEAFRESKNTAVWHLWNAGILEHVIKKLEDPVSGFALKCNRVKGEDGTDLSIVSPSELIGGGSSFSTLQMARIHFSVINGRAPDRFQMITRIKTKTGKVWEAKKPEEKEFWPDGVRKNMHGLLQNTVRGEWGGKYDRAPFAFGGKTGTATVNVKDPDTQVVTSEAGDLGFNGSAGKYNIMVRAGHKNPAPTGTDAPSSVRRVAFAIAEKMHVAGLIKDKDTSFIASLKDLEVEESKDNEDAAESSNKTGFDDLDPTPSKTVKPATKPAIKPATKPKPTTGFEDL